MALVLGRDPGQAILIGTDIRVQVVTHRNGTIRLAITAPRSVRIMREELLEESESKPQGPQNENE